MKSLTFLGIFSLINQVFLVEIKVVNQCSYPIWIEAAPNSGSPNLATAPVRLNTGAANIYTIPQGGWAGRMWPKVGCGSDGQNCVFGQSSPPCPTNGCHPPADTKIEFSFPSNFIGQAWYDISLVDGYSQPVDIIPRSLGGSCTVTKCHIGLQSCPTNENNGLGDLRVWKNGQVVACLSPCKRWNYPSPYGMGTSESVYPGNLLCCPTPPVSVDQCRAGPVVSTQYVQAIKNNCPNAYSFAYDDDAGLHVCSGGTSFDVTFCPTSSSPATTPSPPLNPCTQWGWRFYDYYDIQGNDIERVWKSNRNDCQPICRANPNCRAYTWSATDNYCYLKSGGTKFIPNENLYSALMC